MRNSYFEMAITLTIMVWINKLYTIRKGILRATRLHRVFWKICKILRAGGIFENFKNLSNSFIFIFFLNKQIHHLKGLGERNKILGSFVSFCEKCNFSENYWNFEFSVKMKKRPQNPVPLFKTFWMMYLFVQKIWKWRNKTKFSKIPPSSQNFENFQKNSVPIVM